MQASARALGRRFALLVTLLAGCAALPAAAVAAPSNDDYLDSIPINRAGTVLPARSDITQHTIVDATTEADMFASDPNAPVVPEVTRCERNGNFVDYGSTVWYDVYPHRPGALRVVVDSSGFNPAVSVVPFDRSDSMPVRDRWRCLIGSLNLVDLPYEFRLDEGGGYSIQVGSTNFQGNFDMTVYFDADTDRDGVNDPVDQCKDQAGKPTLNGCPDRDDDNIRDSLDRCPDQKGLSTYRGCPDGDGDQVPDPDDRCNGVKGTVQHAGCLDTDRDGLADPDDACGSEDARKGTDRNRNGCPDRQLLTPSVQLNPGNYCRGSVCFGLRVNRLTVREVPRGTRVTVTCTRRACRRQSKRAGASGRVRFFSGLKIKAGRDIVVKVTKPLFVGRWVRYRIGRNTLDKSKTRCLSRGRRHACTAALRLR